MSPLKPILYLTAIFAVLPHRTLAAIVLPYGPSEGDQQIDFSNDSSATTLSVPVVYFERLYTELYISPLGVVSFDDPISGPNADLDLETKSFVALFFTPASGGTVYYRTRQRGTPLSKEISAKVRRAFSDSPDFESDNTVLITWENLRSSEQDGSNVFQLALATDGRSSYAILVYHKIAWARSGGRIAQAGFFCVDGRNEKLVNSGTDDMRQLPSISNFEDDGTFIYRISGPQPLDPRSNSFMGAGEEDYEEYTSDVYEDDEHLAVCPPDPFHDNCPETCNIVTDDKGCSKCVCAEPPSQGDFVHPLPAEDDRSDKSSQGQVVRPLPPASDSSSDPSRGDSPAIVPGVPLVPQPASSVIETPPSASPLQLGCTPSDEGGPRSDCSSNAECVRYEAGYCCNCQAGYYGNGKECLKTDSEQRIIGDFEGAINGQPIPQTDIFVFINTQEGQQHTALARIPSNLAPSLLLLHPVANVMDWLLAKPKSAQAYNGFQLTGGIFNRTVNIHVGDRSHIVIKQEFTGRDAQGSLNVNVFVTGTLPELSDTSEVTYGDFIDTYRREGPGFIRAYTERDVAVKTAGDERQYRLTVDQQIHFTECPFRKFELDPVQNVHVQRIAATYAPTEGVVRFASTAFAIPPGTNFDLADASGPCAAGRHLCTESNMNCVPIDHTYRCECAPGFQHEADETVPPRFRCVEKNDLPGAGPQVPPFSGASPGCTRHDQCHQWGECVFGVGAQPGHCKCRGWYVGDGVNHCGPPGEQAQPASSCGGYNCDRNAECVDQKCVCRSGFYGNGVQCEYETRPTVTAGAICRDHAECGENAQCVYSNHEGYYKCQCVPPYVGDGIECAREVQAEPATCETELGCHKFAQCVASGEQRICQCLDGYMGDGYGCVSSRPLPPGSSSDQQPAIGAGVQPIERRKCQDQTECHVLAHCVLDESALDSSYYCRCLPGHRGDGVSECLRLEECNPREVGSCVLKANCLYDHNVQLYNCQCNAGFAKQGSECFPSQDRRLPQAPIPSRSCDQDATLCHVNARCTYVHAESRYACICNPGTTGNGSYCEATLPQATPCADCSPHATCHRNQAANTWACTCNSGYVGTGFSCRQAANCLDDRSLCDVNAQCVPDERGTYVCNCNYGYTGNGRFCHPISSHRESTLLIGRGMSVIQRSTAADVPGKQLVVVPHQVVVDIDYDCVSNRIFWSDISGHVIRSSSVNGTQINSTFAEELRSPEGIAVEWTSRNVYYADSIKDEIGVLSMDGRYQKALIKEGLVNPRALAIDIDNRHLYYSDWHRENPHIGRVELDGKNNQVFVSDDIRLPNGLALVHSRKELCWVDAGNQRLSCIRTDGTARRVVYAPLEYPFGLTVHNDERFYWTDWRDHKVHSVTIYGAEYTTLTPAAGGRGKLYGILSIPQTCKGVTTECTTNNGGCDYLCTPGRYGPTCLCPDNESGLSGC